MTVDPFDSARHGIDLNANLKGKCFLAALALFNNPGLSQANHKVNPGLARGLAVRAKVFGFTGKAHGCSHSPTPA